MAGYAARLARSAVLAAVLIFGAGCSSVHLKLAVASTKPVSFEGGAYRKIAANVEGQDVSRVIFIFPTGREDITAAIEDAMAKSGADYLTDVTATHSWFYIPYLYGEWRYTVKGDAWRREPLSPPPAGQ